MSRPHDQDMLDLVAVFALGGINATTGECAEVRAHLAECPQCREEYEVASATAAAIGLSAEQSPPVALRERVLASLSSGQARPAASPFGPAQPIPSLAQRRRPAWVIPGAVAAGVLLAAGLWWNVHRTPPERWAALCAASAVECHASGTVTSAGGVLHVRLQGLAALPAGKQYQAWVIPPGGKPKPEPVFAGDRDGRAALDIPEAAIKGSVVAFTIEPAGGSTAPTTRPFLLAALD